MTNQDEADLIRRNLIEKRAYEIYQARGARDGFHDSDWAAAEQEVEGRVDNDFLLDSEGEGQGEEQTGNI